MPPKLFVVIRVELWPVKIVEGVAAMVGFAKAEWTTTETAPEVTETAGFSLSVTLSSKFQIPWDVNIAVAITGDVHAAELP